MPRKLHVWEETNNAAADCQYAPPGESPGTGGDLGPTGRPALRRNLIHPGRNGFLPARPGFCGVEKREPSGLRKAADLMPFLDESLSLASGRHRLTARLRKPLRQPVRILTKPRVCATIHIVFGKGVGFMMNRMPLMREFSRRPAHGVRTR